MVNLVYKSILLLIAIALLSGCRLPDKQAAQNAIDCKGVDSINSLTFLLKDFSYDEISTIKIREIKNGIAIDSFDIQILKKPNESANTSYLGSIRNRTLHLGNSYQFVTKNNQVFELSDMKLMLMPQNSMITTNGDCDLHEYKLDGSLFNDSNPIFIKKAK